MSGHDHSHHDHDHSHHGHSHGHHHALPSDHGRAFAVAIGINTLFVAVEFVYGFIANSTALMADSGHNLSDVLGLALAWGAAILAKRGDDRERDRGFRGPLPAGRFGSGRGRERGDDREEFRARPRDDGDMNGGEE